MLLPPTRGTEAFAVGCEELQVTGHTSALDKILAWQNPGFTCRGNGSRGYGRNL